MRDSRGFAEMKERLFSGYMLHPVPFFGGLSVIPAVDSADKVAGYASNSLKLDAFADFFVLGTVAHLSSPLL